MENREALIALICVMCEQSEIISILDPKLHGRDPLQAEPRSSRSGARDRTGPGPKSVGRCLSINKSEHLNMLCGVLIDRHGKNHSSMRSLVLFRDLH